MFNKLFNKFKNKKGLTGADVAVSIVLIVFTMGIVTAIYINTVNKSRDNIRHANATRIATNLAEKIQDLPYDVIIANGGYSSAGQNKKVYGVTIPNGYYVELNVVNNSNPDISANISINVSYNSYGSANKSVNINFRKDKELLEETNKPDLGVLYEDYGREDESMYYYPVRKIGANWVVSDWEDPLWYKYDATGSEHVYATVLKTTNNYSLNDMITFDSNYGVASSVGTIYLWIPRFATRTIDSNEVVEFAYLASDYKISWGKYKGNGTSEISAFLLTGSNSLTIDSDDVMGSWEVDTVNVPTGGFLNGTNNSFSTGDGRTGYWYRYGDTTTTTNTPENIIKTKARYAAIELEKKLVPELGESASIEANAIR